MKTSFYILFLPMEVITWGGRRAKMIRYNVIKPESHLFFPIAIAWKGQELTVTC